MFALFLLNNYHCSPAEIRRNNNVIFTSKQRRRFDVIMTLLLCHLPIGSIIIKVVMANGSFYLRFYHNSNSMDGTFSFTHILMKWLLQILHMTPQTCSCAKYIFWIFVIISQEQGNTDYERCGNNFKSVIFSSMLQMSIIEHFRYFFLRCLPQNPIDENSALVHVLAWRHQATSHSVSQCWPRYIFVATWRY